MSVSLQTYVLQGDKIALGAPEEREVTAENLVVTLTDEERDIFVQAIHPYTLLETLPLEDVLFLTQIELLKREVPLRLATILTNFRKHSNLYGTLLFRNLPIDPVLPSTPHDGKVHPKPSYVSECVLMILMTFLGDLIAYADEKDGALIQNICPVQGKESKQENTGSYFLEFHTEDGFHPYKPDYLGLYCVRTDHERTAKTATASVRRALQGVSGKVIALLRKPLYRIRLSSSFGQSSEGALYSPPIPVLTGDMLDPDLCIDFHALEATIEPAQEALQLFKAALEHVVIGYVLLPGDLIIIDNRIAAHARTEFKPRYDGNDRWLQRLFVVQDLRRSRGSRPHGGHICDPLSIELIDINNRYIGSTM